MKGLNKKIGIGVLWNFANAIATRGSSILFTIFLARLLAPEAFGLIAMATVVFELANVFVQSGLGQALIRSKDVSQLDLSTVFLANLGLSIAAYAVVFSTAAFVSDFYNQPELVLIIQVMGLVVLLNATKVVQVSIFSRKMDFKTQMKANVVGMLLSGLLAVAAAYRGFGVWSLVIQVLTTSFISSVVLWAASSWRPSLQFSIVSFKRLFRFGVYLLVEGILWRLMDNSYVLVIGRFFSAEVTGLYFLAKKISEIVSQQLTNVVQQTTFPALATLQDENETLRRKYRQIVQLMMFMIAPVMLFLAAWAPMLFQFMFDEKWRGAVPYLQLLCLVGVLYPLHSINVNLLNVKGRSDLVLKIGLVKKSINVALLFAALPYGILAIAASQIVGSILALIPNTYYSAKLIDYGLKDQVKDIIKPVLSAGIAAVAAVGSIATFNPSIMAFFLVCAAGVLAYLAISYVIKTEGLVMLASKINSG